MTTTKRIQCPACERMAGQLTHNRDGKNVGYTRRDGSSIYRCPWEDCNVDDFVVDARGVAQVDAKVRAPVAARRSLEAWADKYLGGGKP